MKRIFVTAALAFGAVAFAQSSGDPVTSTDTQAQDMEAQQSTQQQSQTAVEAEAGSATVSEEQGVGGSGQAGTTGAQTATTESQSATTGTQAQDKSLGTGGAGQDQSQDKSGKVQGDAAASTDVHSKQHTERARKVHKEALGTGTGGAGKGDEMMTVLGFNLPDDEKEFVNKVHHMNEAEIRLAELAQTKLQDPQLKKHAEKMLKDHQAMKQKLEQHAQTLQLTFSEPKPKDDREQKIMDADKAAMAKFEVLEGLMFEQEYLTHMLADHDKTIAKFTAAQKKYEGTETAKLLKKELPNLQKHRQMTAALVKNIPSNLAKAQKQLK